MKESYCSVFTVPFDELIENYEGHVGEPIEGQVNLVITNSSNNIRREQNKKNSEQDEVTDADMKDFVDLLNSVLIPGGHDLIFCSYCQFPKWFKYIVIEEEDVEEDDPEDPDAEDPITV